MSLNSLISLEIYGHRDSDGYPHIWCTKRFLNSMMPNGDLMIQRQGEMNDRTIRQIVKWWRVISFVVSFFKNSHTTNSCIRGYNKLLSTFLLIMRSMQFNTTRYTLTPLNHFNLFPVRISITPSSSGIKTRFPSEISTSSFSHVTCYPRSESPSSYFLSSY